MEKILARSPFGPLTESVPAFRITEFTADIMRQRMREMGCTSEGEYVRALVEFDCHGKEVCLAKYRDYFEKRFHLASEKVTEPDKTLGSGGLRAAK